MISVKSNSFMASNKLLPSYLFKSQIGAEKTFEIETLTSYLSRGMVGWLIIRDLGI